MLADSHCHAWRLWPYDTNVPDATTRGSADALLYEMDRNDVELAAVVCARIGGGRDGGGYPNEANNDDVAEAVRRHPDRLAAWVDVDSMWRPEYHTAGAADRLEQEVERTGASGFTHYVRPENDGWLRSEEASELFARAAGLRLVASVAAYPAWLADLRKVAAANPTLPVLLHHLGQSFGSDDRDRAVAEVLACASIPNIGVKASGFHYHSAVPWGFPHDDVGKLFARLVEAFGAGRLYWGSDFPASRDHVTYRQSIEAVRHHGASLGEAGLRRVLGGNLLHLLGRSPADT